MADGPEPCAACSRAMLLDQPGLHWSCMATCAECLHPWEGPRHRHSDYGEVRKLRRTAAGEPEPEIDEKGDDLWTLMIE